MEKRLFKENHALHITAVGSRPHENLPMALQEPRSWSGLSRLHPQSHGTSSTALKADLFPRVHPGVFLSETSCNFRRPAWLHTQGRCGGRKAQA